MFEYIDFIWHATDCYGNIASFETGGISFVPPSITEDEEVSDYFWELESKERSYNVVEENIPSDITPEKRDRYLYACVKMAKLGLFAYDTFDVNGKDDEKYRLLVIPKIPLHISEIPQNIRTKLSKTFLRAELGSFENMPTIQLGDII